MILSICWFSSFTVQIDTIVGKTMIFDVGIHTACKINPDNSGDLMASSIAASLSLSLRDLLALS